MVSEINKYSRIQWACRRGMLELDVLLGNFFKEAYSTLSVKDQERFVALLTCNDQDLFYYLTGKKTPLDPDIHTITQKVRHHAQSRHKS